MNDERELLKGNTPMLIMSVLRDGPMHGYGIAREIGRRSGNALQFKEGTLYPALHGLERDELIQGEWQTVTNGRKRKVYRITTRGVAEMNRRLALWEAFAAAVQGVLRGDSDGAGRRGLEIPGPRGAA